MPLTPKPEAFLAIFEPRAPVSSPRLTSALAFHVSAETDAYTVRIEYNNRDMLTISRDGMQMVLFSGDLYRPANADGSTILALYQRLGPAFAAELHGAYTLLLIDRATGQILLVTDRENSVKLLAQWRGPTLIVSNALALQPTAGLSIDRAAVASYLAAGFSYNDRTLYEGIRMLDGASVYRPRGGKLDQTRYWQFVFQPSNAPLESLKKDLGDLLIEAVRIRLRADRVPWLSLSAGEDARAILGALSALKVPNVQTFSYALGGGTPDSDEFLSAQLAAMVGYPHRIIRSYDGSATQVIERNVALGGGMAQVCDEVDAWVTLGADVQDGPMPVLFTGDTRFFRFDFEVQSVADATFGSYMPDFTALSWLRPLIGPARYDELLAATRGDLADVVARMPPTSDGYELRDMLGFHQIHSRLTGTWREYFAGRYFRQARPLLDDDILDLFLRTPTALRRQKRLYIATVSAMFPQLFAVPRAASASYAAYWPDALQHQHSELRALIDGHPSPLDDVIAPDILLGLLDADLTSLTRRNDLATRAIKRGYHLLKQANWRWMPFARPSLFRPAVPARKFLTRALVLRGFLAESAL
jgi:hypothetical protein